MLTVKLCAKGKLKDDEIAFNVTDLSSVAPGKVSHIKLELQGKKGRGTVELEIKNASGSNEPEPAEAPAEHGLEEKYAMGKQVGKGGFSVVYSGTEKATGKKVAIKCIDKTQQDSEELMLLNREIDIMKRLKHPNIVQLYDVYDHPDKVYLVMEFVSGGELYNEIVERGSFTEHDACNLVRQALEAIAYIHENGIAHRDLKPENLLLADASADIVKLADFGLSKDTSDGGQMATCCGSPSYVAPEVLGDGNYSKACDIWSMGVIVYVLLSGSLPFFGDTQDELFDRILSGTFSFEDPCWEDISQEAKDLVTNMLTVDVDERPTAQQCLKHVWFNRANPRKNLTSLHSLRDLKAK